MAAKPSKSKKPTHEAFVVNGEGENAFWTKLGAVWPLTNPESKTAVANATIFCFIPSSANTVCLPEFRKARQETVAPGELTVAMGRGTRSHEL